MIVAKDAELDFPLQDGSTKRQNYLWVAKQTGKVPPDLEVPQMHPCLSFIKSTFDELSMSRQYVDGYPCMISNSEIYYWCKLTNKTLSTWHLTMLKRLDIAYINTIMRCIKERSSG